VCARVVKVFALEVNFGATEFPGEAFGQVKGRGPADEFGEVVGKFALEFRVMLGAEILGLQFLERVHESLGHITSAVGSEMALSVRERRIGNCGHGHIFVQFRGRRKEFYLTAVEKVCGANRDGLKILAAGIASFKVA
jgi:hypothetical protein